MTFLLRLGILIRDMCFCCRWLLAEVLQRNAVSVEERARITFLQQQQAKAYRTQANKDRKSRLLVLFTDYERLRVVIDIFRGILIKKVYMTKCK